MKTENKIQLFVLASAGVFWISVLDFSIYLAMIILAVYIFQLLGALTRTLRCLFSRKRISSPVKNYWLINLIYIGGYITLFAVKPFLPDLLDPLVFRFYFSVSLIIIVWYIINIYSRNKNSYV